MKRLSNYPHVEFEFYGGKGEHFLIIHQNGHVFVWGSNNFGQLALGDNENRLRMTRHPKLEKFELKKVALGSEHSLFLCKIGLFVSGSNRHGQLLLGNNNDQNVLCQAKTGFEVKGVFAGRFSSFILNKNGEAFGGGQNGGGLGCGHENDTNKLVKVLVDERIEKIVAGCRNTFFVAVSKRIFVSGSNKYGTLGLGHFNRIVTPIKLTFFEDKNINVVDVSCDCYHAAFVTDQKKIYVTGDNICGQLGIGYTTTHPAPVLVSLSNVERVFTSVYSTVIITSDAVYSCGDNRCENLGLGDTTRRNSPTLIKDMDPHNQFVTGSWIVFSIDKKSNIYGWGNNENGDMFNGNTKNIHNPTLLFSDAKLKQKHLFIDREDRLKLIKERFCPFQITFIFVS